jgi:pterin-4a-carbinolamine dehydratase
MQSLSLIQINDLISAHPRWRLEAGGKAMVIDLVLPDFKAAFGLMAEIALNAESLNHHPE